MACTLQPLGERAGRFDVLAGVAQEDLAHPGSRESSPKRLSDTELRAGPTGSRLAPGSEEQDRIRVFLDSIGMVGERRPAAPGKPSCGETCDAPSYPPP